MSAPRPGNPGARTETGPGLSRVWVHLEEGLLVLLLGALVAVGGLQVLLRYGFSRPLVWPEEFAGLLLLWLSFVGAAYANLRGSHVAVTMILDLLPSRLRVGAQLLWEILIGSFLVLVAWQGWLLVRLHWDVENPALGCSVAFGEAALPVGALLALATTLRNIRRILRRGPSEVRS